MAKFGYACHNLLSPATKTDLVSAVKTGASGSQIASDGTLPLRLLVRIMWVMVDPAEKLYGKPTNKCIAQTATRSYIYIYLLSLSLGYTIEVMMKFYKNMWQSAQIQSTERNVRG